MSDLKSWNIAVVGPGAMGCIWATLLGERGHCITLVEHRRERAEHIGKFGLEVHRSNRIIKCNPAVIWRERLPSPPDLIVVAVKNYSLRDALLPLQPQISPTSLVLTLQNGLAVREQLKGIVPEENLIVALTRIGGYTKSPGVVQMVGQGQTTLDGRHRRSRDLAAVLSDAGLDCCLSSHIELDIWEKGIINSTINPLTALYQIANGDLLRSSQLRKLIATLVEEARPIAQIQGVELPKDMTERVLDVARATGENRSSMRQDVENCRPTEIESLNGEIARLGEAQGLDVSHHRLVWQLIRAREELYPRHE